MYEIDKARFGSFICQLRKEKGYTQKELAQRLFISDKAVSKWETGTSIPDTTLLIPLSELLGVTATELLMSERMERDKEIDSMQVESLVQQAITHNAQQQAQADHRKRRWARIYVVFLFAAYAEMLLLFLYNNIETTAITICILGIVFGAYSCLLAKEQLPIYYDENKINAFSDGFFRINIPGVYFNNSNWPHMLNVIRIWAILAMVAYPMLCLAGILFIPAAWMFIELPFCLIGCLCGLFIPLYVVGKKYE